MRMNPHTFRLSFFSLLLLTTLAALAQPEDKVKVKVRMSEDEDAEAKLRPVSMVPVGGNNIMIFRSGEFDVRAFGTLKSTVDLYDREKLTFTRRVEVAGRTSDGNRIRLDGLVSLRGKPVLFGHASEGGMAVYAQELNPALTKLSPPFRPVLQWDADVKERRAMVVSAGNAAREPFSLFCSPDSSKLLVLTPEIRSQESRNAVYLLAVLNDKLEPLWTQVVNVGERASRSAMQDFTMDNSGTVWMLLREELSERDPASGADFSLNLLRVDKDGATRSPVRMPGGSFAFTGMLAPLAGGGIACAGTYGDQDAKRWRQQGNFFARVEPGATALGEAQLLPFKTDAASDTGEDDEGTGTKAEQKDKERLGGGSEVIAVQARKDGGFYLVNEVSFVRQSSSPSGSGRSIPVYYHGPLVVRSISKDGQELWSSDLRRWTASTNHLVGNVFSAIYDDRLFLFLLDSEEMAQRRKAGEKIKPKHAGDPYSAYAAFDAKGEFRVKPVLRNEKDVDFLSGWDMVRIGADQYIALGTEKLNGGRFVPVRVDFSKAPAAGRK